MSLPPSRVERTPASFPTSGPHGRARVLARDSSGHQQVPVAFINQMSELPNGSDANAICFRGRSQCRPTHQNPVGSFFTPCRPRYDVNLLSHAETARERICCRRGLKAGEICKLGSESTASFFPRNPGCQVRVIVAGRIPTRQLPVGDFHSRRHPRTPWRNQVGSSRPELAAIIFNSHPVYCRRDSMPSWNDGGWNEGGGEGRTAGGYIWL